MKISPIAGLFFCACAGLGLWADDNADARQKLAALPSAPMIITMDQASGSPTVRLTDQGALINDARTPVPFDQVLSVLAGLPKTAWPYGRVVVVSPPPAGQSSPPKDVSDKVELNLQSANIRLLHAGS